MSRYDDDWRSGRGDWRQNPWDDRSGRQYQDDVRWGGVTYGARDTDRIWQGDDPRDRDYGMVGSWREGRHEARWRDDRWQDDRRQDDRWSWENQDRSRSFERDWSNQDRDLNQWNPLRATHLDTRGYDTRGFDLRGRNLDDRWGNDQRRSWENDQRRFLDNDQRRFWDNDRRRGPFTGKGPRGYQRNWERVRESVCDALEHDSFVDATNIDVRMENGEVTLTGTVSDRQQKRIAERIVERVDGVRDVHNQLRIDRTLGANGRNDTISQAPYNTQASGRSAST